MQGQLFKIRIYHRLKRQYASKLSGWEVKALTKKKTHSEVICLDREGLFRLQDEYLFRPWWKIEVTPL